MQLITPFVKTDLYSMPFHHALCIGRLTCVVYNELPCSMDSRWVQSMANWKGHQREERDQNANSIHCIPVRLPHTGYISLSNSASQNSSLPSHLFFQFQQPLPFHIFWAEDSNNPTAMSPGHYTHPMVSLNLTSSKSTVCQEKVHVSQWQCWIQTLQLLCSYICVLFIECSIHLLDWFP